MKKTLFTSLAFLSLSAAGYAQGFYFRAGLGYALPMAGQTLSNEGRAYNGTILSQGYPESYNIKGASFASGVYADLGIGYMFSQHIGVQLGADIGLAPKQYEMKNLGVDVYYSGASGPIVSDVTIKNQANMPVILTPALVLQTGGKGKLNAYTRMGPALPLSTAITKDMYLQNVPGTGKVTVNHYTYAVSNSFSVGLSAAAGVQYKLGNRASLWAEVSMLSMSVYIKEDELVGFEQDGRSYSVSSLTGGTTKTTYSKSGSLDSNDLNKMSYSQPFSNMGIKVGLSITMGKRARRSASPAGREQGDNRQMSNRPRSGKFR